MQASMPPNSSSRVQKERREGRRTGWGMVVWTRLGASLVPSRGGKGVGITLILRAFSQGEHLRLIPIGYRRRSTPAGQTGPRRTFGGGPPKRKSVVEGK